MLTQSHEFQTVIPRAYGFSYWLFLPETYGQQPDQSWPLILYLHGVSSRGKDPARVVNSGLPLIAAEKSAYPFILLCPQCPPDTWWSDHIPALDVLLKDVCDRYAVDSQRILVTGTSMGGYGVWHLGVTYPGRFAGLVPLCGGGPWFYGFPERVQELVATPVWAFHGEEDAIVPVRESTILVDTLNAAGGQARLTILPAAGHEIWSEVYRKPELIAWMLEQRLAG